MFLKRILAAALALFAVTVASKADTLVMVQGYLGNAGSWRLSGVAPALVFDGWADAGHMTLGPAGVLAPPVLADGGKRFYTLDLPTEAPIAEQARLLGLYVAFLEARHKNDRVVLVGHSAGGVAARMYMVVSRDPAVEGLVTVAAPNLGSGLADTASAVSCSPISWVAPLFGAGTINRSRALYHDLGRESPWNLVGWLNRQPHPQARYVSVIRSADGTPFSGDRVSEAWRQDLRNVPALGARAQAVVTPASHGLQPGDGRVIADILRSFSPAS